MLKKWWVTFIQGLLMIIAGIFMLENPEETLTGASVSLGMLLFSTGVVGLFHWVFGINLEEHQTDLLAWSILSAFLGLLVLSNLLVVLKIIAITYSLWVFITGTNLLLAGWSVKSDSIIGWVLLAAGSFSIIAALIMLYNMSTSIAAVALILGLQVIIAGIGLILFGFAKRIIGNKMQAKLNVSFDREKYTKKIL